MSPTNRARGASDPRIDRPRIRAGIPVFWRSSRAIQVGVDPARAVIIEGTDHRIGTMVTQLDGSRTTDDVVAHAQAAGINEVDVLRVFAALETNGALTHTGSDDELHAHMADDERCRLAPDLLAGSLAAGAPEPLEQLRRREDARVEVRGTGRLGTAITMHLLASGVGSVLVREVGDQASLLTTAYDLTTSGPTRDQLGLNRIESIAHAATRFLTPGKQEDATRKSKRRRTRADREASARRPDLVVHAYDGLGDFPVTDPSWSDELMSEGLAHLGTAIAGPVASIGPLVVPYASACARCVELRRVDFDPAWSRVIAAMSHPGKRLRITGPWVNSVLASATAAIAAQQVLEYLDGFATTGIATWDALLLVRLPGPSLSRIATTRHPDCGCLWAPSNRLQVDEQPQWASE